MKSRKTGQSARSIGATPDARDVTRGVTRIGKRELCAALNWSRPRLDRRLDTDRNFPVAQRGGRCSPWQFDLTAVLEYLGHDNAGPAAQRPDSNASRAAQHAGEATERQRRIAAEAVLLEDRLRASRAELVEAAEARGVISTVLAHFETCFDTQPTAIVQRLSLPSDAIEPIRAMFNELIETARRDVRRLMNPSPQGQHHA